MFSSDPFYSIMLFSISRKRQDQNSLDNTGPGVSPAVGNANNPPGPLAEAQPLVELQKAELSEIEEN